MFKSIFRSAVPVLFLSFFVTYCSRSNDVAQGNDANAGKLQPNNLTKASAAISAETGGYINVGSMQLVIPQGAIASDTQITAELTDIPANVPGAQKIGKGIKFSPEGLQFLSPAELTICYDQAAVNGLNENSTMVYYKTENGELVGIAGQVNPGTHCVKSHIEHFSSYIAVAQAQVAGNTAPTIAGANFLPTTPLAGIPLRVRTQINDVNGGAVTGQIVSAFFIWCRTGDTTCNLNPATATNKVPLQPDTTDDTVTNRYYYLLPASAVTLDGIDYRFQATDNLNMTTTTAIVTRSVPSAANGIQFNVTTLNIGAGFTRALTLQASDNAPAGPWQNISIENQNLSNGALGSVVRSGPSSIRISTTGAGTGTISSTAGAFTANMTVNVIAGLLTHIEITDLNQVHLTGTYQIGTNQTVDFDAVGYDAFGNISTIKPVFSTTGGIGTMLIDATGAHFTAGSTATTGTLTATIAGISDALDILVYVPPAVASTAPVDGATNVNYIGANIAVTFTKSMDTATLTATTTTACTGSIQVSSNGFVDCVPMTSATPIFFSGNALAIVTPAFQLAGNTFYKVRVLASARDTFNYPMAGNYTSTTGFRTAVDTVPPTFVGITPANNSSGIAPTEVITMTFSEPMDIAAISAGGITVLDGAVPVAGNFSSFGNVVTFAPNVQWVGGKTITVNINSGATDTSGNAVVNPSIHSFTTAFSRYAFAVHPGNIHVISQYTIDGQNGKLRHNGYVQTGSEPVHLAVDPSNRFVFSANNNSHNISVFTLNQQTGRLELSSVTPTGNYPQWVAVHPNGKFLYSVSFGTNRLYIFSIDQVTGALTQTTSQIVAADLRSVTLDRTGRFAYIVESSTNTIRRYSVDAVSGNLTFQSSVAAGTTPYEFRLHPNGNFAYTVNENSNDIWVYAVNPQTGILTLTATTPVFGARSITIDATGRFAYVPSIGFNQIYQFAINTSTGALTAIGTPVSVYQAPRMVSIDAAGKYLYSVNGGANTIETYAIDQITGELSRIGRLASQQVPYYMALSSGAKPVGYRPRNVYAVSYASNQVYTYQINNVTGDLTQQNVVATGANGSWGMALDALGRSLHIVGSDSFNPHYCSFAVDGITGALSNFSPACARTTPTSAFQIFPMSMAMEPTGRFAYLHNHVYNQSSIWGEISVFGVNQGSGQLTFNATTVVDSQNNGYIAADPAGRYLYKTTPVAGNAYAINSYIINRANGGLTAASSVSHGNMFLIGLVAHPSGRFVYSGEYGNPTGLIRMYEPHSQTGVLSSLTPTSITGYSYAIAFHPTADFAYALVSDNGNHRILTFTVDSNGGYLTQVSNIAQPVYSNAIKIDPSGRFAYLAGHGGNMVCVYSINAATGALTHLGNVPAGAQTYDLVISSDLE